MPRKHYFTFAPSSSSSSSTSLKRKITTATAAAVKMAPGAQRVTENCKSCIRERAVHLRVRRYKDGSTMEEDINCNNEIDVHASKYFA